MASFRAQPEDFDEVIRIRQRRSLRRQAPYPLVAGGAATVLFFVHQPTALVVVGMCIAWAVSTYLDWRGIRAACLWRHAWAQEDAVVDVRDDGLHLSNKRGAGFVRWDSGAIVRRYSTCFVVEEEGDEIAVIPKRYLNATELLILENRAVAEAVAPNEPQQPSSGG